MPKQKPLFESDASSVQAASTALAITAQQLGPEQQLFNQLLEKIEKQSTDLQNLKALADAHALECNAKLIPLRKHIHEVQEKLVLFLDQRLQTPKGLSQRVCADIEDLIAMLLDELSAAGDLSPPLQAVTDRYDMQEGDDLEDGLDKEMSSEMNRAMAQAMGAEVDSDGLLSTDEMVEALMRKLQANEAAALQAHEAHEAKRKKSAKQKKAEQEELDAHSALRSIYRKLASALHPDRETDNAERARKTALMVRVNAANDRKDRKDLLALLRLQLEIDQIDPSSVASMADDKLRGFNRMLKSQLKDLQAAHLDVVMHMRMVFDLGYGDVNPKTLAGGLRFQTQRLHNMLENLKQDLILVQDDKALKKWIKLQIALIDSAYGD